MVGSTSFFMCWSPAFVSPPCPGLSPLYQTDVMPRSPLYRTDVHLFIFCCPLSFTTTQAVKSSPPNVGQGHIGHALSLLPDPALSN